MNISRIFPFFVMALLALQSIAQPKPKANSTLSTADYVKSLKKITDVMVEDVTDPVPQPDTMRTLLWQRGR
jgi:hypothetical protein